MASSGDRGTPPYLVRAARSVLRTIYMDPASSAEHNERVGADIFYGPDDEALESPWKGAIFLNPPGSCPRTERGFSVCGNAKACSCKLVPRFWNKLISHWASGDVEAAIWIGFSVEQFQVLQSSALCPLDFQTCIFRKRVKYLAPNGKVMGSPPHSSYATYVSHGGPGGMLFARVFGQLGYVTNGSPLRTHGI